MAVLPGMATIRRCAEVVVAPGLDPRVVYQQPVWMTHSRWPMKGQAVFGGRGERSGLAEAADHARWGVSGDEPTTGLAVAAVW